MRRLYEPVFRSVVELPENPAGEVQIICPFHADTAPSCRINLGSGLWKCFGCQSAGSAATFIMMIKEISYKKAEEHIHKILLPDPKDRQYRAKIHKSVVRMSAKVLVAAVMDHRKNPEIQHAIQTRDRHALIRLVKELGIPKFLDESDLPPLHGLSPDMIGSQAWWSTIDQAVKIAAKAGEIPPAIVKFYARALTDHHRRFLKRRRGWTTEIIQTFQLGWDEANERYAIPIYEKGLCVNIRKYLPGALTDKMISYGIGYGAPRLFPYDRLIKQGDLIVLLEGEPDVILAQQLGLPAATFTGGAGTVPREYYFFFKGKNVVVCYDCDEAGRKGAGTVVKALRPLVASLRVIDLKLPYKGGDFTDWILKEHHTAAAFWWLMKESPRVY